ncbi:hypothetical protein C7M84_005068 [Penaeus vannamei]|uniref:RNA-directed DNA polymerase n=1 Tax=Penaeus vannamei TaxID=6689 RepID=A0A3R7MH26_PENVA|nr:hypothetical protein C7M84_005068 [Penaeus vannamei]
MEEMIDELGPSVIFSILDARSAYWSIELSPDDRPKTAFSDGTNLWQFKRMPYGLKTAGATYQRMINFILSPVLGRHTMAYLDDVVIYSKNFDDHLRHLEETLKLVEQAGFKLNLNKCQFAVQKLKLLGFVVSTNGVTPDPDKVTAIASMPAPRNVKEVRRFLGASGFFRRHVANYATIAAPLTSLTRKDTKFQWGEQQDKAFDELKRALVSAPVLRRPNFAIPFEIHTDASNVAIGACLMQRIEGNPHAIAYFSRKLKGAEVRYCATDTEALAVVEGIRAFNAYVYGRTFEVFTDHRPLTFIFKRPTKSAKMSRWSHEIASYDCKIIYKPGAAHHVPDLLSRAVAAIDLSSIDPDQFRMLQLEDPLCRDIIQFVEGKALPRVKIPASLDEFEVNNGVLYHVRELPSGLVSQLVLPPKVRPEAMKILHNSSTAGHPANPLATEPFERVSVDLIELPVANNGDRYVLTIVDELTRFIQLVPMPTKDAHTVADALISHFITLFGPPVTLLSDNGSEFTGEYFREVCELLDLLIINLYLLTGRECTFPVGLTNHHTRDGEIGNRQLDLLAARDAAVTGTQRVREENMEGVDKRTKAIPELREGTLILRKRPPGQARAGLASRWIGPFRIIKKVGPVSYIIRDLSKYTEHRVHRNQIVPFKVNNELRLMMPEGVQPEDVERPDDIDPDDPINVMPL